MEKLLLKIILISPKKFSSKLIHKGLESSSSDIIFLSIDKSPDSYRMDVRVHSNLHKPKIQ